LKEREKFVSGSVENGVSETVANEVFDEMVSFASYAFNKSHAAAYAYLAYQTAYLKYHYRGIYMAALMSSVMGSSDKLAEYINSCRDNGIKVCCPDVNKSFRGFTFKDGVMYFGLLAIKNAGSGLADKLILDREQHGDFKGLQDFCERIEGRELNKKALENMIKAGAFDGLGLNRRQMLDSYETFIEMAGEGKRGVIDGQLGLFGNEESHEMGVKISYKPEFEKKRLFAMEKEAAGMYLSGDPLDSYKWISDLMHTDTVSGLSSPDTAVDGKNVKLLCTVESTKVHITKRGDKMCFAEVSDGTGVIECVVFPELYALNSLKFTESSILILSGKLSVKDDRVTVICGAAASEREFDHLVSTMKLCIKTTSDKAAVPPDLVRICDTYKGSTEICYYLTDMKKIVKPRIALKMFVCQDSAEELEKLFGASQIGLIH
ncbi:MAG TPA: DNA polymerase III subunit alpha, partial [Ruminococcus flavefaciens]|nr:DNA polymerase III subunit alpha [Ruminococcus flavefaciens]